jgi:hypothetical protein
MKYRGALAGFIWGTLLFLLCAFVASMGAKYSLDSLSFISFGMLIMTPISVGAVTVFFSSKEQAEDIMYRRYYPMLPVLGWSLISVLLMWETIICIIMLLPLYLPLSILGGRIGMRIKTKYNRRVNQGVASCFAILPILMMPLEQELGTHTIRHSVTNSIQINAPVDKVWQSLANIEDIKATELRWNVSHFIGLPKPKAAITQSFKVGEFRELYWEKGIHFQEKITQIIPNKLLAYDVIVDYESMKIAELDTHITVGDQYFDVESGFYSLSEHNGISYLSLTSSYRMSTKINWYGKLWANFVLDDFHASVLELIRGRVERGQQNSVAYY